MTAYKFMGPQQVVLPHQRALEGATGTLVLTPGESYDFGDAVPPGPRWWWDPEPPEADAAEAAGPEPDHRWDDSRPGMAAAVVAPAAGTPALVLTPMVPDEPGTDGAEG